MPSSGCRRLLPQPSMERVSKRGGELAEADGDLVAALPVQVEVVPEEAPADHPCIGQVEPVVTEAEGEALDVLGEGRGDVKEEVPGRAAALVGDEVGDRVARAPPGEGRTGKGAGGAVQEGAVAEEAAVVADGEFGKPDVAAADGDEGSRFALGANRSGQDQARQNGKAGEQERGPKTSSRGDHAPRSEGPRAAGEDEGLSNREQGRAERTAHSERDTWPCSLYDYSSNRKDSVKEYHRADCGQLSGGRHFGVGGLR